MPSVKLSRHAWHDLRPVGNVWRYWPIGYEEPIGPLFPDLLAALAWPELTERRRRFTPYDSPLIPLKPSRTGAAGEIDLREVRTIVYSADPPPPRRAIFEARRRRLLAHLQQFGYRRVEVKLGGVQIPYCATHCRDHAAAYRAYDAPLLWLECDAEPGQPITHITPPSGTQLAMIGCDRNGIELARILASKSRNDWRRHRGILWRPATPGWIWIAGALSAHAWLWLDKGAMLRAADYIANRTGAVDASLAELHHTLRVSAPTVPLWWQNDGHNGPCSSFYCPPELRDLADPYWQAAQ